MSKLVLSSPSFRNNEPIPIRHTGMGEDVSPALQWSDPPSEKKSFALICDDPDAPAGTWTHWVLYSIPPNTRELPEGVAKTDIVVALHAAKQGVNDFHKVGYGGPMPPQGHGIHHYHFKLYALDNVPDLRAGATKRKLENAMQGHILAMAELVGTFERP